MEKTQKSMIDKLNLVVLDLETTGLNPKYDKIIEIGAIRIREGKVEQSFSRLINPGIKLSEKTTLLTGITDEMLIGKQSLDQILDSILDFLGEDMLLGHHIIFDYSFLKKAVINAKPKGYMFERNGIDTLKIARMVLPADRKKTLENLCADFGISYHPHRAGEDALATWMLFKKLVEYNYETNPHLFEPKPLCYQVKRESPIMQKQIEQIKRLQEQYRFTLTVNLEKMTKNEASRYIDRIRSEYGCKRG